jgi:hypothetical protein
MSVYRRLGGTRMLLLIALHPIRLARMVLQAGVEWLREEWERARGELDGRATHSEGIFPFIRILSNVVVRELQTMAVLLDLYLGVPIIYTTYMQYDELAHHFGPSSRQALSDLKRTDARVAELWRMITRGAGRGYDLVILSDHGMTPSVSYRVRFKETLGTTINRMLSGVYPATPYTSHADASEYADVGAQVLEAVAQVAPPEYVRVRRAVRRARDWVRSHYGLSEIFLPEKYRVDTEHDVVATYSSCLAHVYFADDPRPLDRADILSDARRSRLLTALIAHPGIGVVLTRAREAVYIESAAGRAMIDRGTYIRLGGDDPLALYGNDPRALNAIARLVHQPNGGDLVLFGAYDGTDIICFDDQVGAHGCIGGDQTYPFVMTPSTLDLADTPLNDARDIHAAIMTRYARPPAE